MILINGVLCQDCNDGILINDLITYDTDLNQYKILLSADLNIVSPSSRG